MSPASKIPPGLRHGMAAAPAKSESQLTDSGTEIPRTVMDLEHRPRPSKPKRTRYTLDLDPDQHAFLTTYARQIEANASEVMRGLLRQLEADPGLADRVRDGIWASGQ